MAAIPEGSARCFACGAVYGEDNRCPHCRALAGIRAASEGYRCLACNGPRERRPGTVLFGSEPSSTSPASRGEGAPAKHPPAATASPGPGGLRMLGVLSITAGIAAAALSAVIVPGALGLLLATALGGLGVGGGAWSLRRGGERQRKRTRTQRQLALLQLAEGQQGIVSATDAAQALGISLQEADAALTEMADGSRVVAEITVDGRVEYIFRELRARAGDRVPLRIRVEEEVHAAAREHVEAEELASPEEQAAEEPQR